MTNVCIVCGNEFEAVKTTKKYCSPECASKSRYQREKKKGLFNKTCEVCGKFFTTTKDATRFCSISCANKVRQLSRNKEETYENECPVCGIKFLSVGKNKQYCSVACRNKQRWAREKKTENTTNISTKERLCATCSKSFIPTSNRQKCCCRKCWTNARKITRSNKTCEICGKKFIPYVSHQTICSPECKKEKARLGYYKKNNKKENTSCLLCGADLSHQKRKGKYCSKSCAKKAEYLRNPFFKKECAYCGNKFETRKKQTRFCSAACSNRGAKAHPPVTLKCETCGIAFEVPYIKRSRRFCSKRCANTGENNSMYGMTGEKSPTYGQTPWTKGKTAETDERLAALGKKISVNLKEQFASGKMSNAGENNPSYGKKGKDSPIFGIKRSVETKEKMSEAKAQQWLDGKYDGIDFRSLFKRGKHYSTKLGRELYYRSSYEKIAFEFLDADDQVVVYDAEPFSLEYDDTSSSPAQKRRYIPDLLITYKDGTRKMVEIKPEYLTEKKKNQAKFSAAREYCSKRNILFEVWTEKQIAKL